MYNLMKLISLIVCVFTTITIVPIQASAKELQNKTSNKHLFNLGTIVPKDSKQYQLAESFYTEVFNRLGYQFAIHIIPAKRLLIEVNSGRLDGDLARAELDLKRYPNLIKISEPVYIVPWGAYSSIGSIHIENWNDLTKTQGLIGYLRGSEIIERRFSIIKDKTRLYDITSTLQAVKMLDRNRINILVADQILVDHILDKPEFQHSDIKFHGILERNFLYLYLNKKHGNLVSQFNDVIRAIKEDGTYNRLVGKTR